MTLQFEASLLMMLAKARIVNYDCNCSFIVLATVITIVNYDRHLFIVQATAYCPHVKVTSEMKCYLHHTRRNGKVC